MKKKSKNEVQQNIDKVQNNRIKLIGNYVNIRTKTDVKCVVCGLIWESTPKTLLRCPVGVNCYHHINLNEDLVKKRIMYSSNGNICMLGKYKGAKNKTDMLCKICGYKWQTQPYIVYSGHGCPDCSKHAALTTERFNTRVKKICGNEYTVIGEVNGTKNKVEIKHSTITCDHIFLMTPHDFLSGQRCPKCAHDKRAASNTFSLSYAKGKLRESRKGEFSIVDGYTKLTGKCWIKHNKCNNVFYSILSGIIYHSTSCPYCYSSYGEEATRNYLKKNNYSFKEQFRIEDCKNERALPFDFVVFKDDKILFLIEYQGVQHYTAKFGESNFEKTKINDEIKLNYCKKNNINLIRIPYKRWDKNFNKLQLQVNRYLNNEINMLRPNQALWKA